MTATITDALRPYKGAIMALVTATKPDGSKWTYKEILRDLGMPVNHAYERAVSKMVNKEGLRRRADFKRSKPDEDGGLLDELDADNGDYGAKDEIAAALNRIARDLVEIAKAAGLPGYRIISIDDPSYD